MNGDTKPGPTETDPCKPAWRSVSSPDVAQFSSAAERNRQPILQVLRQVLPAHGVALEIASGSGQHVSFFASGLPGWSWQPSDATSVGFGSIAAWCGQAGVANVRAPVVLDVLAPRWPSQGGEFTEPFDAIFCANMLHIAPWATCAALMQGASRHLASAGVLVTYGPYRERDVPTAQGNLDFDRSLRQRNRAWGIRLLEDVLQQAALAGLHMSHRFQMPANNLVLVFKRTASAQAGST